MRNLLAKVTLAAFSINVLLTVSSPAQNPEVASPIVVHGENYETTIAELDRLARDAADRKLIILIARLGNGEISRKLYRLRLRAPQAFLEAVRRIAKDRFVAAEGERVKGRGRMEVYLDGKLYMVFTLPRNQQFRGEA